MTCNQCPCNMQPKTQEEQTFLVTFTQHTVFGPINRSVEMKDGLLQAVEFISDPPMGSTNIKLWQSVSYSKNTTVIVGDPNG